MVVIFVYYMLIETPVARFVCRVVAHIYVVVKQHIYIHIYVVAKQHIYIYIYVVAKQHIYIHIYVVAKQHVCKCLRLPLRVNELLQVI